MRPPLLFTVPADRPPVVTVPTDPAKLAADPRFIHQPEALRRALNAALDGDCLAAEKVWAEACRIELARLRSRQPRSAWDVWPGGES